VITNRARRLVCAACVLVIAACSSGSSTFSVNNASVDSSYRCPVGANNVYYDLRGTIDAHNGTTNTVTISKVAATMTLASVKGPWLEKVGDKYDAASVGFTPTSVGASSDTTLAVTVPSACTGRAAGSPAASGDYAVTFTITTSAGTFKVDSTNKHHIATA
jgi:hypothetical protein